MAAAGLVLVLLIVAAGACSEGRPRSEVYFVPQNTELLQPAVYPDAGPGTPARAPTDPRQIRAQLVSALQDDPSRRARVLAVFDDRTARERVPDPPLLAALAILMGTSAEGAVDTLLTDPNFEVMRFSDRLEPGVIAGLEAPPGRIPEIHFSSRFAREDFRALAPIVAHEVGHLGDRENSAIEELVLMIFDARVWAEIIVDWPEVARSRTPLTRENNTWLLEAVNSVGPPRTRLLGLRPCAVFLDSPTRDYTNGFASRLPEYHSSSPGSALASEYINALLDGFRASVADWEFDQRALDALDTDLQLFSEGELAAIADTLELSRAGEGAPESADRCAA